MHGVLFRFAIACKVAAAFAMAGLIAVLVTAAPAAAQDGSSITILHNNDGESHLLPDEEDGEAGVARFVATMKALQSAAPGDGVVTLTSGDNFLASKEFSASLEKGVPYYDSIALSGVYDTIALGNHDFDFGPEIAAAFISGFDPAIPFLSANADFSGEPTLQALVDEGRVAASTVVETDAGPVGVIGAITPRLPNISSPRNVVISSDVAAAVNAEAAALEADGVNRIILISHLQGLTQDQELVPQLVGVDVVIAGGGDELLKNAGDTCLADEEAAGPYPSLIGDIPVVTGPGSYRCIGQLTVTFDADGNVTGYDGGQIGVDISSTPDADVQANVVEPIAEALAGLTSNVIATSEVDLDGRRASVRTMSSNEGALLSDAILHVAQERASTFGAPTPVVGIQNGGGIRNDAVIPAGDFTEADSFDVAPFGNFVVAMEISRERFKELLENAVSGLPDAEGRFAQPAGFTMGINPDNPGRAIDHEGDCSLIGDAGSRVVDVTLDDGTKIVSNGEVVAGPAIGLATIDFLARGGDCYPLGDTDFTRVGASYQQALAEYVQGPLGGTITAAAYPEATGRISIVDGPTDAPDPDPLPTTGSESAYLLVIAAALLGAGLILRREVQFGSR